MVVDEVIGYAQAPCVTWVSTQVTIPAPSDVVGMPGKGTRGSRSLIASSVRAKARLTTVLMAALQGSKTYESIGLPKLWKQQIRFFCQWEAQVLPRSCLMQDEPGARVRFSYKMSLEPLGRISAAPCHDLYYNTIGNRTLSLLPVGRERVVRSAKWAM